MSRHRSRRHNRRGPYGRNYDQSQSQHRDFAQGFAQNNTRHQAQHQPDDHTRPLSAANSTPLGPRVATRNRSVGTQVSRGVQTVSREGGKPSMLGPNGVYPVKEGRLLGARRARKTIIGVEAPTHGERIQARIAPRDVGEVSGSRVEPAGRVQEVQEEQMAIDPAPTQPATSNAAVLCAKCDSEAHTLASCMHCGISGMMDGCPHCNTLRHGVSGCGKMAKLPSRDVIDLLVYGRANMPPFNGRPWFLLFKDYIKGRENFDLPTALPWTVGFALEKQPDFASLQAELDAHRDHTRLPVDPATKDWETVQTMEAFSNLERPAGKTVAKVKQKARPGFYSYLLHKRLR
ncbi:hypothetical protein BKA56DRAFT_652212 [Ilyonectria sp. MPI-CAGE-AT-0026]|nr:hypothetical protein BKA56DRAFT_652212 [Ilyonectria sp. MPI-CAGE-AT-0026]